MPAPISEKIRWLIVWALEDDVPPEEVAKRYRTSEKSAKRFHTMYKETGSVAPKPMGGDRRSHKIEAYHDDIIGILEEKPDRTLEEIGKKLATIRGKKAKFSISAFWRFFKRHTITIKKKTGHAAEQTNPKIEKQRGNFIREYPESHRVIFIDETGVSTNMTRSHGRCTSGERLKMAFPHGHRLNLTCVAAITDEEMLSRWIFKGAMNTALFVKWITEDLVAKLRPGDTIVMDNLSVHKTKRVKEAIEITGARILFLPPYSPDFNPIEKAFAKLKALLRRAEKRTVRSLKREVKKILDSLPSEECAAFFRCCINEMKEVRKEYLKKIRNKKRDN